jgi:hypothetical protein
MVTYGCDGSGSGDEEARDVGGVRVEEPVSMLATLDVEEVCDPPNWTTLED